MAMSKEEKAVRAALAQLEKDSAVSDAAVAKLNQPAAASNYEDARSRLSEIKDPKIRAAAEKAFAGADRQTERLTTEAAKVGLQVTPTGTLAPIQQQSQQQPQNQTLTAEQYAAQQAAAAGKNSAYDLLLAQFKLNGLEALVTPLKDLITNDTSDGEMLIMLRETPAYQTRFAANKTRIASGLRALNESEYLGMEDKYQTIMRNYGLPASYYAKGDLGRQEGFEKLIGFDVSATELEDRIMTAQSRVINANPEVTTALKQFYPDITNGEILAYTLDPTKGLSDIKRKITAAEIGGAALGAKTVSGAALGTSVTRAEELARYGITKELAQKGYSAIGGGLERGRQLSSIYQQPDYNQAVAEEEVFSLSGKTQAEQKRKKVIGLEKATFGGQTGVSSGALSQNRAGSY